MYVLYIRPLRGCMYKSTYAARGERGLAIVINFITEQGESQKTVCILKMAPKTIVVFHVSHLNYWFRKYIKLQDLIWF